MEGDIVQAAKFIGAGLSMIGALGGGIGIGLSVHGALGGMARNPDMSGSLMTNMILGIAFLGSYRHLLSGDRLPDALRSLVHGSEKGATPWKL